MSLTDHNLAEVRKVYPLFREGLDAVSLEAERDEVRQWELNSLAWRAAGNRPESELPISHAEARRLLMHRRRSKRYRKNKKKVAPNVTVHNA
jgi:hypothetical protein